MQDTNKCNTKQIVFYFDNIYCANSCEKNLLSYFLDPNLSYIRFIFISIHYYYYSSTTNLKINFFLHF